MPPKELQEKEGRILNTITEINKSVEEDTQALGKTIEPLSKLATGGKVPNYASFTTEELRAIYDGAMRSTTLNDLSDGVDKDTGRLGKAHPHSVMSILEGGVPTSDLSREEMIEGIDGLLQAHNYNIDPMLIASAQGMMLNARSAEIDGRVVNANFDNMNLEGEQRKKDQGYQHTEGRKQIRTLKDNAQQFSYLVEDRAKLMVQNALHKQLAAAQDLPAGDVAKLIEEGKRNIDTTSMTGVKKDDNRPQQTLDLTGADLTGVDLSESDLTDMTIDAETLSRAMGIESVKGVSDAMKQGAAKMQPYTLAVDQLKQEQDRLRANPSRLDRFVSFLKHGNKGILGEIEKLDQKIAATKLAMNDQLQGITTGDRQNHVDMMKQGVGGAKKSIEALDIEIGNDNLAQAYPKVLAPKSKEERGKVLDTREALKTEKDRLKGQIKTEEKAIKVREKLGPKPEAPQQGHGKKLNV